MNQSVVNAFIIILTLLASCQYNPQKNNNNSKHPDVVKTKNVSTFDTTVILKDIVSSQYKGPDLNDSIAKVVLYTHFTRKGYFTQDNLPDISRLTKEDIDRLSVDYKSIYKLDINNSKKMDAVITYWLAPPYANGHCFQPHKAIISDTDSGYHVTNEEFMPDYYVIDSIIQFTEEPQLLGYYYECANHKIVKSLNVRLCKRK